MLVKANKFQKKSYNKRTVESIIFKMVITAHSTPKKKKKTLG